MPSSESRICTHCVAMRTPPPVLQRGDPAAAHRTTLFDSHGPEAATRVKAAAYAAMVFALTAAMSWMLATQPLDLGGFGAVLFTLVAASGSAAVCYRAGVLSSGAAGGVARPVTMPSGASSPYEDQFSYQDALAARGDVVGALESFEAVIAEQPCAATPRLKAADLYARRGKDPRRAAALFREVRDLSGVSRRDALYAASRLVDLYDGPLEDPGRALVELRRIAELYPETDVAAGARTTIRRIKERLAAERGES